MQNNNNETTVHASLSINAETKELVVLHGTEGPSAIDVRSLYANQGLLTYDPGFRSTASCKSAITYIDGANGILRYRGYPIEELAKHSTFTEVAYLLMFGELPKPEDINSFTASVNEYTLLHDQVLSFYVVFRRGGSPHGRPGRRGRRPLRILPG